MGQIQVALGTNDVIRANNELDMNAKSVMLTLIHFYGNTTVTKNKKVNLRRESKDLTRLKFGENIFHP